jgi:tetratricopeptide (TPR) repeat protein
MSSSEADEVCANCGKAAVDDVKLKQCACKLVKYCSVECQKNHRPQHKKECNKKARELRDDKLFRQPDESHLGECPICCLSLPLDGSKYGLFSCCCKRLCNGCCYANQLRELDGGLEQKCPYCREKMPETDEEITQNYMERAKVKDPVALFKMGVKCQEEGNFEGAFEYWTKAAGLGDIDAHHNLSVLYNEGQGVEKDMKKELYHLEEASIGGHPHARYNLGYYEARNGRYDRAVKHWIIAANLGCDNSMEAVKNVYALGFVSKEDFEASLRGHQAATDATKSKQRDEAYAWFKHIQNYE